MARYTTNFDRYDLNVVNDEALIESVLETPKSLKLASVSKRDTTPSSDKSRHFRIGNISNRRGNSDGNSEAANSDVAATSTLRIYRGDRKRKCDDDDTESVDEDFDVPKTRSCAPALGRLVDRPSNGQAEESVARKSSYSRQRYNTVPLDRGNNDYEERKAEEERDAREEKKEVRIDRDFSEAEFNGQQPQNSRRRDNVSLSLYRRRAPSAKDTPREDFSDDDMFAVSKKRAHDTNGERVGAKERDAKDTSREDFSDDNDAFAASKKRARDTNSERVAAKERDAKDTFREDFSDDNDEVERVDYPRCAEDDDATSIGEASVRRTTSAESIQAWARTARMLPIRSISVAEGSVRVLQALSNDISCWSLLGMLDVTKCLTEFTVFNNTPGLRLQLVRLVEQVLRAVQQVSLRARECGVNVNLRRTAASVEALRVCVTARKELEQALKLRLQRHVASDAAVSGEVETDHHQSGEVETDYETDAPDDDLLYDHVTSGNARNIESVTARVSDAIAIDENSEFTNQVDALLQAVLQLDLCAKRFLLNAYQAKRMTREVRFLQETTFTTLNSCFNRRYADYLVDRFSYMGDKTNVEKCVRGTFLCATEKRASQFQPSFERVVDKSDVLANIATRYVQEKILQCEDDTMKTGMPRVYVNISERKKIEVWNVLTTDEDLAARQQQQQNATAASVFLGGGARNGANADSGARVELGIVDLGSARFEVQQNFVRVKGYASVYLCNRATRT